MPEATTDTTETETAQPLSDAARGYTPRASWPFSLDAIRQNLAHLSAPARETLIGAFRWCIDPRHPVTRAEFAKRVGYSETTIYRVFTGKYCNPETGERLEAPEDLIDRSREFLTLEQQRYEGGSTEFVITPTVRRIWTAADLARESQSPVFIWGPSHIGKTWALVRYTQTNNHGRTIYTRLKAASGLGGMVRRIGEACGVSDKSNSADLIERIKRALSKDTLLILDEVHQLMYTYRISSFFACLEVIREIIDEVGCGCILCGTDLMMEKTKGHASGELQQLWRRGVHKVPLPTMPTKADLTAILKSCGLDFPDSKEEVTVHRIVERPYEILRQLAKREGLKAITERIRYARKLMSRAGVKPLTWSHFVDAHLRIAKQAEQEPDWS